MTTSPKQEALGIFKNSYLIKSLNLPDRHSETDHLHQGLLLKLQQFLPELGRDLCFVGSQYPLQVQKQ